MQFYSSFCCADFHLHTNYSTGQRLLVSDNYSLKFRGSELAWEIYFLSSRGSTRIFQGSRQMSWISTLSKYQNPKISRPAMLVVACHVIGLFYTTEDQSSNQTLIELFPVIYATFAQTVLNWCWTDCDTLTKILMCCSDIWCKCLQLKCVSQWCAGHKFCALCHMASILACQRCTFGCNN